MGHRTRSFGRRTDLVVALGLVTACGTGAASTMGATTSEDGPTSSMAESTVTGAPQGSTGGGSTGLGSTGDGSSSDDGLDGSEGSSDGTGGGEPVPQDGTPPLLTQSVIDLDGVYDPGTGQLAALSCTAVPGGPEPYPGCYRPFRLPEGPVAPEDLGAMTFIARAGAEVRVAAGGFVDDVEFLGHDHLTHSDMYAIRIRLGEDSAFWLEYLQVKDLLVEVGDPVEAGDVLGLPGDYHDLAYGKVGFGVIRHQEVFARLCPSRFADATVLGDLESALDASTQAFGPQWSALCLEPALACVDERCDTPESFVPVGGDIDRGRRRYENQCAMCHGENGEGDTHDPILGCTLCGDHSALAEYIDAEMPPAGAGCSGTCAEDVAAFIQWEFGR